MRTLHIYRLLLLLLLSLPASAVCQDVAPRAVDDGQWWGLFADPTLDSLLVIARAGNNDVAVAALRIDQATQSIRQAEAALATARSENDYAAKHLAAMEKVWRSDAVSEMELEQARFRLQRPHVHARYVRLVPEAGLQVAEFLPFPLVAKGRRRLQRHLHEGRRPLCA